MLVQVEWTKCGGWRILIADSESQSQIESNYTGRVADVTGQGFTLLQTKMGDFGDYCCKFTLFPLGPHEGRIHLRVKPSEQTPPISLMMVSIVGGTAGALLLGGFIARFVICKKYRGNIQNPMHVTIQPLTISQNQPSILKDPIPNLTQKCSEEEEEEEEEEELEYLNVPST
ncbi:uncharacterized protein LOC114792288 isoform X2 [Denticeps clupeoides]|nr:uncharacterized protein LOC114792288 isoform X2 [Denticeps clupeoides]